MSCDVYKVHSNVSHVKYDNSHAFLQFPLIRRQNWLLLPIIELCTYFQSVFMINYLSNTLFVVI